MSNLRPLPFSSFSAYSVFKSRIHKFGAIRKADARIVFVCGASQTSAGRISRRAQFMEYAKKHLLHFRFFLAEDVFEVLHGSTKEDLLSIEDQLGDLSDCIMIFCESESAFAELGAFSLKDQLAKQVLVVNDQRFRQEKSFINLGPIARTDRRSIFKPAIHADFDAILRSAESIKERLESNIPHRRGHRVKVVNGSSLAQLAPKDRLFLIADFINLFGPVTTAELVSILSDVFGGPVPSLDMELALGRSLGFFRSIDSQGVKYMTSPTGVLLSFFDFESIRFSPSDLRSQVFRYYFRHDQKRLKLAAGD